MNSIPIVIDTDPALGIWREGRPRDVDDGLAIVEAINAQQLDLLAVTVTYGNAALPDALRVAQDLVRLKQVDIPVLRGADRAMAAAGQPSMGESDAVRHLRELLTRQRIRIAAIGPLTNLGELLTRYPELATQIEEVVIVAGRTAGQRFYLGDVGPVRDFNFENDPFAAQVLLNSGVPIVMAGFELSSKVVITDIDLQTIRQRGTPSANYLYENSLDWFKHWTKTFPADAGFHPWDSAAVAWFLRPELYVTEQRGFRIREEPLTERERGRNPDGSPTAVPWLETGGDLPGPRVTYCTAFKPGADKTFVDEVIQGVF